MLALPAPRLTATITPPTRKGDLGAVVVHGYIPPPIAGDDDEPRPRPRPRVAGVVCSLCRVPGHARSNRKFHPRDTSEASAARFLALRAQAATGGDPRRPDQQLTTLQQMRVDGEYRYREVETGRVYTAAEARALTTPHLLRYIDELPRSA